MSAEQREFDSAVLSLRMGRLDEAERDFRKVLKRHPSNLAALNLIGVVLTRLGKLADAETYLRRAISLDARSESTLYNYGIVLKSLGKTPQALDAFSKALAINAAVPDSWNNRGTVFNDLARYDEAIGDFDKALALNPDYAEAHSNRGHSLAMTGRPEGALQAYASALRLKPTLGEAWLGEANVFVGLGDDESACVSFQSAVRANPALAEAWVGLGNALSRLRRPQDAAAAYDHALAVAPGNADALVGRGYVLAELGRYDLASASYTAAHKCDPSRPYIWASALHCRAHAYQWDGLDAEWSRLLADLRDGAPVSMPFPLLATAATAEDQFICARQFSWASFSLAGSELWRGARAPHDRIRLAYYSMDFRDHPVMQQMAGVFEHHDRKRFETFAFSYGPNDDSAMRKRVASAFDHFLDVGAKSDLEIATLMREREIDIVVDLQGHTTGARTNVLAARPAPVQVNYLGYAGTVGADFIDYIIADRVVIPPEQYDFYSEKVAHLPYSYMPNDATRPVAEDTMSRAGAGLPDQGFVFCSFNNNFKITPEIFDAWMRVLRAVEGSVLWVRDGHAAGVANLRVEAEKRGVATDRLVFAGRVASNAEHLARHRLADLFLDTLHYNAHATCGDALWAGLPVLTCLGSTYAGRAGASMLAAAGLPELVTTSIADYEALAVKLAREPQLLASLRERLARTRSTMPLFDTARTARHLEAAYLQMWERHQRGEPPEAFSIGPITPSSGATV